MKIAKYYPLTKWVVQKIGFKITIGDVSTDERRPHDYTVCTIDDNSIQAEINANLIANAPEMVQTLIKVNQYFVDLQNKCALTPKEEKLWKEVSKNLFDISEK